MNIVFIEPENRLQLYPLNLARPNACLRIGASPLKKDGELFFPNASYSYLTEAYLKEKFPPHLEEENLFLNPMILPSDPIIKALQEIRMGEVLYYEDTLIAFKGTHKNWNSQIFSIQSSLEFPITQVIHPWDFFAENAKFLHYDFEYLRQNRTFQSLPTQVQITGEAEKVFMEKGAQLEHCILNTSEGEIYIAQNAIIKDGAMLRGPLYIGENAVVNMGAKIYGQTTIGPYCKVGGEIHNSVLMQYSNKGHDGFLGNSVIGEWCNLGADTNNSNLKNTYTSVECWSYLDHQYKDTHQQFCGLMMGDHSKSAINTQFNTGTIAGFSANIFMSGFPPKHIPSFSFGGGKSAPKTRLNSAIETAILMMKRRNIDFTQNDEAIFNHLYENV